MSGQLIAVLGALSSAVGLLLGLARRKPSAPAPPAEAPPGPPLPAPPSPGDVPAVWPPPPPADPPPVPTVPPSPPLGSLPTMTSGGRAFVLALPPEPSVERDALILEAIKRGFHRRIDWTPIDCSAGGRQCTVFVADDALAVGTDDDFVRVNVRQPTAQRIADHLGAVLPTTRISDRAWLSADVTLPPLPQSSDAKMAYVERMLDHHDAIEAARAGRTGLVRTVGKDFIVTDQLLGRPDRCAIFGWHSPHGEHVSPGGLRVIQDATAEAHWAKFTDYSQIVCLCARLCIVDGQALDLEDVMKSPAMAHLVSDEGPMLLTRHPAVPAPPPPAPA